jgi:RNA polymerase sigma-70 factor (ECF subfamily)
MTDRLKDLTRQFLGQRHLLLAFIYGLVRDWDAAEEILQEVWIRLAESEPKGMTIDSIEKWCRGVARNLVLQHLRQKRSGRVVADSRIVELAERAFDEHDMAEAVWSSRRGWLYDCLERLPDKSRRLLQLKYGEGLRVAQIAEHLQHSQDAIFKALSRIRRALADCVERRRVLEGGRA